MTKYPSVEVKLSDPQLDKLKSVRKNPNRHDRLTSE